MKWFCVFIATPMPLPARPGAGKISGCGRLEQRQPVVARIDLRRLLRRLRERGRQVQVGYAGLRLDRRRIDQAVPAHEHAVVRGRQLGHHVPALIVGDHDLDEIRRQIFRFRDDPDAGLGPGAAADDPSDEALRGGALCEQGTSGVERAGGYDGEQNHLLHGARLYRILSMKNGSALCPVVFALAASMLAAAVPSANAEVTKVDVISRTDIGTG